MLEHRYPDAFKVEYRSSQHSSSLTHVPTFWSSPVSAVVCTMPQNPQKCCLRFTSSAEQDEGSLAESRKLVPGVLSAYAGLQSANDSSLVYRPGDYSSIGTGCGPSGNVNAPQKEHTSHLYHHLSGRQLVRFVTAPWASGRQST